MKNRFELLLHLLHIKTQAKSSKVGFGRVGSMRVGELPPEEQPKAGFGKVGFMRIK